MIGKRRQKDAGGDRPGLAEMGGQEQRQKLGAVAHLGDGDRGKSDKEDFHDGPGRDDHGPRERGGPDTSGGWLARRMNAVTLQAMSSKVGEGARPGWR